MALPKYATPLQRIWRWVFLVLSGLILFFLVAPIFVIIPLAFNAEPYFTFTPGMLSFDPEAYSLRWFQELRDDPAWARSIRNSFFIAILATFITTALGTLAALGLNRPQMPWRGTVTALLISPMIVPLIITAAALFSSFTRAQGYVLDGLGAQDAPWAALAADYAALILSHVILGAPFVVITVTASLSGFDRSLIRASQSLGANERVTFFKVILPLLLPGVVSGALFAFITSLDEVVIVSFLGKPQTNTMTIKMFSGLKEDISPAILALAAILVAMSIVLLTVVELLRRRAERLRGMSPG